LTAVVLKTILLTTETSHHLYFLWKLGDLCPLHALFWETHSLQASFETAHPFEEARAHYEKDIALKDAPKSIMDSLPVYQYDSVNDGDCVEQLKALDPDIIIIFGTGKVCPEIISIPRKACLNLHGGAPEFYRGLDTHLWAIYHNDFQNLITTLHFVEPELDTGKIVFEEQLPITQDTSLEKLRIVNTKACVNMSALAINGLSQNGYLPSREQLQAGRYYSFMPKDLKEVCVRKYKRYLQRLR
jgi:methionyl-tRNA formyltransferase